MDNFESLYDREDHFDVFTDLLFNVLLGFAFMFFIAFVLINLTVDVLNAYLDPATGAAEGDVSQ